MKIYSYNEENVKKDRDILLKLMSSAKTEEERIFIYGQLSNINYFAMKIKEFKKLEPSYFHDSYRDHEKKLCNKFLQMDDLTNMLVYYWAENLRGIRSFSTSKLPNYSCNKDEFFKELILFFDDYFPDDLKLIESTFSDGRINIRTGLGIQRAEIIYLEDLQKYYIDIYVKKMSIACVSYAVHEFGHASLYNTNKQPYAKDEMFEEIISTLYEMLFINSYCEKNNLNIKESEMGNLFYLSGVFHLDKYFECPNKNEYINYINIIDRFYSQVIALYLFSKRGDAKEFYSKIEYIKKNISTMSIFQMLKNIDITENELIYTTKNMKKLILSKD